MIVEIVTFDLPQDTTRAEALVLYKKSAATWANNGDLVEKYYFFDAEKCLGGGVYIWPDRAAAARWHGESYRNRVRSLYGAPPRIEILDALMRVDPLAKRVEEF
jgi:hypothetical protein